MHVPDVLHPSVKVPIHIHFASQLEQMSKQEGLSAQDNFFPRPVQSTPVGDSLARQLTSSFLFGSGAGASAMER